MQGMVEVGIYQGNVDGARFEKFVDQKLCPNLLPFNGVNPRSVVIMGKVKLFGTPTQNCQSCYDVDYFSVPCRILNCLSFQI